MYALRLNYKQYDEKTNNTWPDVSVSVFVISWLVEVVDNPLSKDDSAPKWADLPVTTCR